MIFIESSYWAFTRTLLTLVGIWPYYMSSGILIKRFLIFLLLISGVVVQLNVFATREFSLRLFMRIFAHTILKIIYIVKYVTFLVCGDKIKEVLHAIQIDLDSLTDERELKIMEKCFDHGKQLITFFNGCCYPPLVIVTLIPFVPDVLDLFAPLNETRPHDIPVIVEYFVDQEDFIYLIIAHLSFIDIVGIIIIVSTESTVVFSVLHVCGLFRIACNRIEYAFEECSECRSNEKSAILKLIKALDIQKRALVFVDILQIHLMPFYFILLCLGVASLSLNLYVLTQILHHMEEEITELIVWPGFVVCHFMYLFVGNYVGQIIIDSGNEFYIKVWNTHWYAASNKVRKLLPFILQKSAKEVNFNPCGIFIASYEGFSTVTSMSMSYFAVIYSLSF